MQSIIRGMEEKDRSQVLEMMRVFYASPAILSNGSEEIFEADVNTCISDSFKKASRGTGVGKLLYHVLEDSLKRIGVLNMNACIARLKEEDEHLCNDSYYFHEKMGFHLVGTFHNCGYKFNTWYDMIWMEKIIGEHQKYQRNVRYGEWTLE